MRAKDIFSKLPVPSTVVKLVWSRLTFNRITTTYITLSFLVAFFQIPLQIAVHNVNADARRLINLLLTTAQISPLKFTPVLTDGRSGSAASNGAPITTNGTRLEVCESQPAHEELDDCIVVWAMSGGQLLADGTLGEVEDDDSGDEEGDESDSDSDSESGDDDDSGSESSDDEDVAPARFIRRASFKRARTSVPRHVPSPRIRKVRSTQPFNPVEAMKRAMALPDAEIRARAPTPVKLSRRDNIVAEALFDIGLTPFVPPAVGVVSPNSPSDDDDDEESMTPVAGLRITDPAQDGSLVMIANPGEAFTGGILGVVKAQNAQDGSRVPLAAAVVPRACALSLLYPQLVLHDASREDISLVAFHIWLLALHVVAVLNESVVYILVSVGGQFVAAAWSIGVIVRTANFHNDFDNLIARGACGGVDVLPNWYHTRLGLEIPVLVIGFLAFIALAWISWTLIRVYSWQTYKRIGGRPDLNRMYKVLIVFSVSIQLSAFFVALSCILWLDQLQDSAVVASSSHGPIYRGTVIPILCLSIFWLILGWLAVRRESRLYMHIFLFITLIFIAYYVGMITRSSYRFTIRGWPFFAWIVCAAMLFLTIAFVSGIWCRVNFGKGLKETLLEASMNEQHDGTAWDFQRIHDVEEVKGEVASIEEKPNSLARAKSNASQASGMSGWSDMSDMTSMARYPTTTIPELSTQAMKHHTVPTIALAIEPFVSTPGPGPRSIQASSVMTSDYAASISQTSESSFGNSGPLPALSVATSQDTSGRKAAYAAYERSASPSSSFIAGSESSFAAGSEESFGTTRKVGLPSSIRPPRG